MEAIKQSVRPKHQVLILKCYPRLPKNSSAAEIKPKGSELSYLLYYASSRKSKLSKVGAFLEKKTIHDIWKGRTAAVQITLQILYAFLNNPAIAGTGAQGFGLFAPYILSILREVLKDANEAILVEAAVPMWDGFCKHQDHITLSADADFCALFAEVVTLWAAYATKEQVQGNRTTERRGKMRVGVADKVKLRMAGLMALKSTADSDTLVSDAGRQLDIVIPVILQNLYDGDGDLDQIKELNAQMEAQEKENKSKPRHSIAVPHDTDRVDGDARAAGRSVAEADRLADQEASILALRCLKSVFSYESRTQVRSATISVLGFILAHRPNPIKFPKPEDDVDQQYMWAVQLFKTICSWIPVQDRFIALFTTVESLIHTSVQQDDLYRSVLLAHIISKILASDVNLIGLSVMDVLLGLLRHIVNVISESHGSSATNGSSEEASANDSHQSSKLAATDSGAHVGEAHKSPLRARLVLQLQQCVSNLAVHVYYTDQISDMVIAILMRLKPSSSNHHSLQVPLRGHSLSGALNQGFVDDGSPSHSDAGLSNSSYKHQLPNSSNGGISFNTPLKRQTALNAVRSILICANDTARNDSYVATNRNAVPMTAWEGSHWLLKEPEEEVRAAYVRAFGAWLDFELPKLALKKALDEERKLEREWKRKSLNSDLARRAANTASARKAAGKRHQLAILQGIHLTTVDLLAVINEDSTASKANVDEGAEHNDQAEHPVSTRTSETSESIAAMRKLAARLDEISTELSLMDLEEFRASQPAPVPAYPPSPKPPSTMLSPNNHSIAASESDAEAPSRRPSNAASFSNLKHPNQSNGRSRANSGTRRSASLSGGARVSSVSVTGSSARPPSASRLPGTSARQDFASNTSSGRVSPAPAQVEELKRLLATSSRSSSSAGLNAAAAAAAASASEPASSGAASVSGGVPVGAGNAAVARRALGGTSASPLPSSTQLSSSSPQITSAAGGASSSVRASSVNAGGDADTTGSESMVEMDGSWAGTSFATPDRSRDRERDAAARVDVRALLESLPMGDDERDVGRSGPPVH